jgi:ABC-type transport system involved in multi-copper enzyme maturation permease subunit
MAEVPIAAPVLAPARPAAVSPVRGMLTAAFFSARQFLHGPRKWLIVLAGLAYPALLSVFVFLDKKSMYHPFLELFDQLYLQGLALFVALLGAIPAFSSDVEDGTIVYLFSRPTPRWMIVIGKWLGMIVPLVALALIPVAAAYPFATAQVQPYEVTEGRYDAEAKTMVFTTKEVASHRSEATGADLFLALETTALGVFQFGTLFYALGVAFSRPYIISLSYAVVFEVIIGRTPVEFPSITRLVRSAAFRIPDKPPPAFTDFLRDTAVEPGWTAAGLIAVPIVSMALACWFAKRKSVIGKGA